MKKSKILLGKAGILKEEEEEIEVRSGNCKNGKQECVSIDFIIIHACVDSFQALGTGCLHMCYICLD